MPAANWRREEDQGVVILLPTSAPDATLQQKELFGDQVQNIMAKVPEADQSFQVISPTLSIAGITLKPWDQRTRDATTIQRAVAGPTQQRRRPEDRGIPAAGAAGRARAADPVRAEIDAADQRRCIRRRRNSSPTRRPAACSCSSTAI